MLMASVAARADVILPNGTTIPLTGALGNYLNGSMNNDFINEGINVITDAAVEPQVFSPLCDFSGKYIAKGGGANFAVGWYNVDENRPDNDPPLYVPVDNGANLNVAAPTSDIQILFPFAGGLPAMVDLTAVSIRESPAYLGGYIGFVLIPNPNGTGNGNATQYHYTEHRFNTYCHLCSTPGPWYSDLIYKSKMLANTFYLGFEDLDFIDAAGANGVNGNDLDYEDFLFRFTGVACPGAGEPCDVPGGTGACTKGITDCDGQGQLVCKATVAPGMHAETCDGVDNDCNGSIDDGATCPDDKVCDHGVCVASCGGAEFPCGPGLTCDKGLCVEPACVGKTCPEGQVCHGGECVASCTDVVCPAGQVCSGDHCSDPCAGVTCVQGQVCVGGVCVTGCGCRICPTGQSCDATSQQCIEEACVGVTCGAGTYCKAGTCIDVCEGVKCPSGETCQSGACVSQATSGSSSASSSGVFAGSGGGDTTSSGSSSNSGGMGGGGAGGGGSNGGGQSSGCGCRIESEPTSTGGAAIAALALSLAAASRRRRRH
ncbi:Hypothetical protein A7982_07998 [Minicystis rosea]|nr:Hypothetical protein A7982_07998 [Minicystis rosea]